MLIVLHTGNSYIRSVFLVIGLIKILLQYADSKQRIPRPDNKLIALFRALRSVISRRVCSEGIKKSSYRLPQALKKRSIAFLRLGVSVNINFIHGQRLRGYAAYYRGKIRGSGAVPEAEQLGIIRNLILLFSHFPQLLACIFQIVGIYRVVRRL